MKIDWTKPLQTANGIFVKVSPYRRTLPPSEISIKVADGVEVVYGRIDRPSAVKISWPPIIIAHQDPGTDDWMAVCAEKSWSSVLLSYDQAVVIARRQARIYIDYVFLVVQVKESVILKDVTTTTKQIVQRPFSC